LVGMYDPRDEERLKVTDLGDRDSIALNTIQAE
jgi:hypothetical protein